jgi:hypothetical protein
MLAARCRLLVASNCRGSREMSAMNRFRPLALLGPDAPVQTFPFLQGIARGPCGLMIALGVQLPLEILPVLLRRF